MIFVTVGTHEQQFNRLVEAVDNLKRDGCIEDDVFIQSGYCDYLPKHCQFAAFVDYEDMINLMKKSTIVITHGGPSSFMLALYHRKQVIVVPRQKCYDEHVNDHQIEFVNKIKPLYPITVVEEVSQLKEQLAIMQSTNSDNQTIEFYNKIFCSKFEKVVERAL